MSVKSRSKTFKPGDIWFELMMFIHNEIKGAIDDNPETGIPSKVKKRLTITITYDRDVPEKV